MKRTTTDRAPSKTLEGTPRVERRALNRLHALDEAIELIYYASLGVTREADDHLARFGFSQAHHRVMYILARHAGLSVGELVRTLGISKQAAQRPIRQLIDGGFVSVRRDTAQHRFKILQLTAKGRELEHESSSRKRAAVKRALGNDREGTETWLRIMRVIADDA